jgi:hypothetical protein
MRKNGGNWGLVMGMAMVFQINANLSWQSFWLICCPAIKQIKKSHKTA